MGLRLTTHNSMGTGRAQESELWPNLSGLEGLGYTLVPIQELTVLNTNPHARYPDYSLRRLADDGVYDAIMSGCDTILVPDVFPRPPHGPVFRRGRLDTEGNGRSHFRGIVAVLADGSVVMGRTDGTAERDLRNRFDQADNPLVSALGGGALLIEERAVVSPHDLSVVQLIGGMQGGMNARCMGKGVHTIMGIRKGKAFAGWCTNKSARAIQEDFYSFGFGTVIKFSYGSRVFFDDCVDRLNGVNGTGFGIERPY
jgi:hypothetical protein